ALISLTLVPMMSSKIFAGGIIRGRVADATDRFFRWLSSWYERTVRAALAAPAIVFAAGAATIALAVALFSVLPSEYAPAEDRQRIWISVAAPEGASLSYVDSYLRQVEVIAMEEVERGTVKRVQTRAGAFGGGGDVNIGRIFMVLNDWDKREESAQEIAARLRSRLGDLPVRIVVGTPSGLGIRGGGAPVQIVL